MGREKSYHTHSTFAKKFSKTYIIKMLIFVMIDGHVFQQKVGISMGTNCDLLVDLFLYSYKAHFIQELLKENERKLSRSAI